MAAASAIYVYEGKDRQGRKTKGEITSVNPNIAKAQLRKQGITTSKIRKKATSGGLFSFGGTIKPNDVAMFTRQMATMMKAGVPLVQSFDIVADGSDNPKLRDLIREIRTDVSAGNSFASAIQKHPREFDELFCNLIHSGEQSGSLETMLERVATYMEKTEALKGKIKSALVYPVSVVVIAFIVAGILLIYVVPQFEMIFAGFGADLPAFTQFVVGLSEWAQKWWLMIVGGIAAIFFVFRESHRRSQAFRDTIDRLTLRAPIAGDIIAKSSIARFARTLSTTFSAGVPLVDALQSVSGATGNIVYKNAVRKVREDVSSGQQLNYAMRATGVFPNMVLQMTQIGEESGALDEMLDKAASYFEEQVDNAVDSLTSLMEPMIMAFLGVMVGGLLIAMYLPIFQMGQVVGG